MSSANKLDGIVIKKIDPSQTDLVVAFLKEDFLRDEPLGKSMQMKASPAFEKFIKDVLKLDASFMAIDTEADNKLVGVRMNGITRKDDPQKNDDDPSVKDEKFEKIIKLMHDAFVGLDIFNKYNIDVLLDGRMLSVHKDYRGREIAGRMMEATFDFMRKNKIPLFYIPCTSAFTVRVVKKLGFKQIIDIPYDEYLVDGKRVFYPEEPHKSFAACIKFVN